MALPGVSVIVQDGNLNIQPGSNEHVPLLMGVCTGGTPATLYSFGDSTTMQNVLGYGKLVELAAYVLDNGGGPIQVMPMNPSQSGAAGSVTHTGTGSGAVSISLAPHVSVTIACTTLGTLGTAQFTFALGSGAASQPVVSQAGWSSTGYLIPGTYCVWTPTAGSYTTSDVYTISTLGVVSHTAGAGPAIGTQSSSPVDNYSALVTIGSTGGAVGTAQFTYSLDNGEANLNGNGVNSSIIVTAAQYAIPNTGIVLNFSSTFVAGDTYSFKTASAFPSGSDLASALTALETTYISSISASMIAVSGMQLASSSAWASQTSSLETAALALFNSGIYVRFLNECPTVGSVSASAGAVVINSADTDTTVASSAAAVNDPHDIPGAGDCLLTSPLTGLTLRRNAMWTVIARACSIEASRNPGDVSLGGVPGVAYLFRDEQKTPGLDAARFCTLRTFPGVPGIYITDFHTMALSTSDFSSGMNARVIDRACGIARVNAVKYTNGKVPTTTRNSIPGVITNKFAEKIEGKINSALETGLVDTDPQDAVGAVVTVNRTHNILSDSQLIMSVGVQPFAYSKYITVDIGMTVQA